MAVGVEISAEPLARGQEYGSIRGRLCFARTAEGLVILALLAVTHVSKAERTATEERTTNQWLVVLVYVLLFGVVAEIVSFPLSVYSSWHLPRHYGLSHQSFGSWLADQAKGWLIGGALGLGMMELLYF